MDEAPSQVRVTVVRHPGGLTARSWLAVWRRLATRRMIVSLAVVLALAAGTLAGARLISGPGVAAGFPSRCVSLTIALHDPRFLRTDFDRALPCQRLRQSRGL